MIWFLFPHLTYPGTLPWVCTHPLAKMDIEMKASGRNKLIMAWHYPLTFDPQEPFCTCVVSPLSPKRREWRSLNPLLKQAFAPLCPWLDYYFKMFMRDKPWLLSWLLSWLLPWCVSRDRHWIFTLFLLLLPFQRANRRLIVNAWIRACLSLVSRNANSFKYPARSPLLRVAWNVIGG